MNIDLPILHKADVKNYFHDDRLIVCVRSRLGSLSGMTPALATDRSVSHANVLCDIGTSYYAYLFDLEGYVVHVAASEHSQCHYTTIGLFEPRPRHIFGMTSTCSLAERNSRNSEKKHVIVSVASYSINTYVKRESKTVILSIPDPFYHRQYNSLSLIHLP